MRQFIRIPAILLTVSTFALPQPTSEEESCVGTTYDTAMCLMRVLKKTDEELNRTYQQAMKVVKGNYTAKDLRNLRNAQRLWISYRDAACEAEYGLWGGGSGGPAAHSACLISITRERIAALKEAYLLKE